MLTCHFDRVTCCVGITRKPGHTSTHGPVHDHMALCSFSAHTLARVNALIPFTSPVSSAVGVYNAFISALHIWIAKHAWRTCTLEVFAQRFTKSLQATRLRGAWACWCSDSRNGGRRDSRRGGWDRGLRRYCKH